MKNFVAGKLATWMARIVSTHDINSSLLPANWRMSD
jgi:hypothetical protein